MYRFAVIDDDRAVVHLISKIIEQYELGEVVAEANDCTTALERLSDTHPHIAVVDYLMPKSDGLELIARHRSRQPDTLYVMLSQVQDKQMIARAYESGVEFFISKPINVIEVVNVLRKVVELLSMRKTISVIQNSVKSLGMGGTAAESPVKTAVRPYKQVLTDLGIVGDLGSKDILNICEAISEDPVLLRKFEEIPLHDLLKLLQKRYHDGCHADVDPKALEMRIRRTLGKAIKNIASLGIEDFTNEKFTRYATTLFDYSEIKSEMDCLRGRSAYGGKINVKTFIRRLMAIEELL